MMLPYVSIDLRHVRSVLEIRSSDVSSTETEKHQGLPASRDVTVCQSVYLSLRRLSDVLVQWIMGV